MGEPGNEATDHGFVDSELVHYSYKPMLNFTFCKAGWEPGNMATQYVFHFFWLAKLVYVKERGGASNADLVNQKHSKDGCKEVDGAYNGS